MCFSKFMGKKGLFWKTKAPWRGVYCCAAVGFQLFPGWHMAPPHSWSRSPTSLTEEESQELGTAQHSLATLADGVLQILGCSSSPLKCSSGKMQNLQVSRENLSLFCSTRNLCGRTPLCKTPCFTFFGFSSLSPFPCIPAYNCSFKSHNLSFSPCSAS